MHLFLGIVGVFSFLLFRFRYQGWFERHLLEWLQVEIRDSNQIGFLDEFQCVRQVRLLLDAFNELSVLRVGGILDHPQVSAFRY